MYYFRMLCELAGVKCSYVPVLTVGSWCLTETQPTENEYIFSFMLLLPAFLRLEKLMNEKESEKSQGNSPKTQFIFLKSLL